MMRPSLAAALTLAATQAAALTCAPPDPLQSFVRAQESPESWVVLHGRLYFDAAQMPPGGGPVPPYDPPPGYVPPLGVPDALAAPVPGTFDGDQIGRSGFAGPVAAMVTLQPMCAGPWCGSMEPGGDWLVFGRVMPDGSYEIPVPACGGWAFEAPSPDVLEALAACMAGGVCGAS